MKQLLVDETWELGKSFSLIGKAYRYLYKVRRVAIHDELPLLTKDGVQCVGVVKQIEKETSTIFVRMVRQEEFCKSKEVLPIPIIFCPSLLKGSKTDDAIRNGVQSGASQVCVIKTKHSVKDVVNEKREGQFKRWQRVVIEATQQSGNPYNVEVSLYDSLAHFLKQNEKVLKNATALFFHERQEQQPSLHEIISNIELTDSIFIFVGPEGGFAQEEVKLLLNYGAKMVWLGPMVLRAENAATAAIGTTSLLLLERGKWHLRNEKE